MFFKNYRTVIFVGAVFAAALLLLSYHLKYDSGGGLLKNTMLEIAAPMQKLFSACLGRIDDAWMRYIRLVGLQEENRRLKDQIAGLQSQLLLYQEGYRESQRLQDLFTLTRNSPHHFVAAAVIGREQAALSKTLWINKGFSHGLKPGMPVVAPPGLVGRLTDVTWHSAKVLLLIDESSNVDVLIQRTRVQGIVRGAGARGCVLKYISKVQDVKEGDVVVSAGMSNVFPKGLLIGKVSYVDRMEAGLFVHIQIAPFVDFSKVEEILVLVPDQQTVSVDAEKQKKIGMIYYFFLPFVVVGLVVLQSTLADILFSSRIMLELSLIVVIYAGFRMDLVKGMILAALTGFVLDCVSGAVVGLFTFIYLLIFTLSFFVSLRVVSEKKYFIALFSVCCSALEALIISLVYRLVLNYDMSGSVALVFVPQALLIGVLSVGFFYSMRSVEGLIYGKTIQSPQRSGTGGISSEA